MLTNHFERIIHQSCQSCDMIKLDLARVDCSPDNVDDKVEMSMIKYEALGKRRSRAEVVNHEHDLVR